MEFILNNFIVSGVDMGKLQIVKVHGKQRSIINKLNNQYRNDNVSYLILKDQTLYKGQLGD